jgi:predicted metal-dependent phosphoesterase TrpH
MNFKVDLHTHSIASPDGGINATQYHKALESGLVDCVAITDHNRIDFATYMKSELGDNIIVGEEIMTSAGEIIGLYLESAIQSGLSPLETVKQIKNQNGLVYIPHPFETVRHGLHPHTLEELVDYVDVIEVCNGRAFFQNRSSQAVVWTRLNQKLGAASSDAHGIRGLGKTYTGFSELPNRDNLLELLTGSTPMTDRPGVRALLYPKYHRLRKKIRGEV